MPQLAWIRDICRDNMGFTTPDDTKLEAAHVGDIVVLEGKHWRVTKKTNFNAAEDWLLEQLGRRLP